MYVHVHNKAFILSGSLSFRLFFNLLFQIVSAKFVFDTDLYAFDSPTKATEQFIEGVTLCFDCFGKMLVEPPLYKLYPNKLFRDFRRGIMVSSQVVINLLFVEHVQKKMTARRQKKKKLLLSNCS